MNAVNSSMAKYPPRLLNRPFENRVNVWEARKAQNSKTTRNWRLTRIICAAVTRAAFRHDGGDQDRY